MIRFVTILAAIPCFLLGASGAVLPADLQGQASPRASGSVSVVDSLLTQVEMGRHWHAARQMRRMGWAEEGTPTLVLLLAEAEAGWGNWQGVRDLLEPLLTSPTGPDRLEGKEPSEGDVAAFSPGPAWLLLARAREELGAFEAAEAAYGRVLEGDEGEGAAEEEMEALARRARVRGRMGEFSGAMADLRRVVEKDSLVGSWLVLEVAEEAAGSGDPEATVALLALVPLRAVAREAWRLPPRALLEAGDSAGAEAAYWSALPGLDGRRDRAWAWERVGTLRLARGDSVGARGAFHRVVEAVSYGREAVTAARGLGAMGYESAAMALGSARILAEAGRNREALEAFEAYEGFGAGPPPAAASLEWARVLLALGDAEEALERLETLAGHPDREVGIARLALESRALRRSGRPGRAAEVRDEIVEAYPDSDEAVEILFLDADARQDRGDREGALRAFRRTAELAPSRSLAGQARMRMGQLLLSMGRSEEAARVYRNYLEDFPDGRRWDQAAFWAGSTLFSLGRTREGEDLLRELVTRFPLSYYAVRGADLLGEDFTLPEPAPNDTLPFPPYLEEALEGVRRLDEMGLDEGRGHAVDRAGERVGEAEGEGERRGDVLLRLALELNGMGLTREGINLGWDVRRTGRPWDVFLLKAVYPFPFRGLVLAEAQERDLDPHLMAGLIRQESAFWSRARSRADARGLMQVLPSTGRELARSQGPRNLDPDDHLYRPEINMHLGMAFFADLRRRFGARLPILLSAYNAGPTRARRWMAWPEAEQMDRFVERIPFAETRGYVKNVLRNRGIYARLYPEGGEGERGGEGTEPPVP